MKNNFIRVTALILSMLFMLSTFVGCAKRGELGPVGPPGEIDFFMGDIHE